MGQARDLRQRSLEVPHELQRTLRALGILRGVKTSVAWKRRDLLVQARVVLHRARAQGVRPRVEVEVAARDAVVVANDLGLGDLGQLSGFLAKEILGNQLGERGLGHVALGHDGSAPALDRALEDRARLVALELRRDLGCTRRLHEPTSAVSRLSRAPAIAPSSERASRSMSALVRRSVIATRSPFSCSGRSWPIG